MLEALSIASALQIFWKKASHKSLSLFIYYLKVSLKQFFKDTYFSLSASRLSRNFARNFGPINDISLLLTVGKYWLMYISGSTGKKQIQASSNWWAIATRGRKAHLSLVILLSVDCMVSLKASPFKRIKDKINAKFYNKLSTWYTCLSH